MRRENGILTASVLFVAALALAVPAGTADNDPPSNNPDVNNDGAVDLLDIIIVGQSIGRPVPEPTEGPEIAALKEENANLNGRIMTLNAEVARLNALLEPPVSPKIDILDFQVRIMQQNDFFWKFSWNLTLANGLPVAAEIDADVLFLDSEGFIVDHGYMFGLPLAAGESRTFRGDTVIFTEIAPDVAEYEVELDW